jgi:hypothetical protein
MGELSFEEEELLYAESEMQIAEKELEAAPTMTQVKQISAELSRVQEAYYSALEELLWEM